MNIEMEKCPECGAPIIWDSENEKARFTCACMEMNPCQTSDGCCQGMCLCDPNEKDRD